MGRIAILGGGVCGLASGMLLARDAHDVVVLERDAAAVPPAPDDAWDWTRGGVAQFRQPHYLHPAARRVLDAGLPDLRDALLAAGALRFDTLLAAPPTLPRFERRPGDEQFATITARRAVLEQVFARTAAAEPRMEIRRGVAATGLAPRDRPGGPQVIGVETGAGETVPADLVVDAMGRRSALPELAPRPPARPRCTRRRRTAASSTTRATSARHARPRSGTGCSRPSGRSRCSRCPRTTESGRSRWSDRRAIGR